MTTNNAEALRALLRKAHMALLAARDQREMPDGSDDDLIAEIAATLASQPQAAGVGGDAWAAADAAIANAYPDTDGKGLGWWGAQRIPNWGILRGAIARECRRFAAHQAQGAAVDAEPARWFASGPEGSFFTDDHAFAETLLCAAGRDRDEWTITDVSAPPTPARSGEDVRAAQKFLREVADHMPTMTARKLHEVSRMLAALAARTATPRPDEGKQA